VDEALWWAMPTLSMDIETLKLCGVVILLAPLAGAVVCGALGPVALRDRSHWPAIVGVGAAFVAALVLLGQVRGAEGAEISVHIPVYEWITAGAGVVFNVEFLIDPLTAIMLVTVTGIALLVVIYSRDYMRHGGHAERGYERFFAFLALFVFSMCALVLGGNFLLLYLGWEAVGLCSYLLIGFYYGKPAAAAAAKKAFLVNRVGDFGFGLGIFLIYLTFGSLEYGVVFDMVSQGVTASGDAVESGRVTAIALLLFCGACGKSAQLPLHVWLPDAMEGPSPVSALIHAATMVTAGIYMVARCGAIFTASPTAMLVVAIVGAITALFAATIAIVQTDMKRILAYSTISQLGYMVMGVGVFAADSAIFHLFTHAFFKALLFLSAGSVMHAMGGVIDVRHFSGLRRLLPYTFVTFLVGSLALSGFPMLSGFFSKDEIIHHALAFHPILGVIGLLTALITAFYTFRMVFLAFFGQERLPEGAHPHESGAWMLVPLFVLAAGAIGAGYLGTAVTGKAFHGFLEPVFSSTFAAHHPSPAVEHEGFWSHYGLLILSGGLAVIGIAAAYLLYVAEPWLSGLVKATAPRAHRVLWNKYYVDEAYDGGIVKPLHTGGRLAVGLDDYFIDGLLWIITAIPKALGYLARVPQSGMLQGYGLSMVIGITVIVLLVFWA
jgi:NADH-quinone oxidoreductase subunit L